MKYGLLYDGMEYWRRHAPEKRAVVLDGGDALTYAQLGRWSDGVAAHLTSMGVKMGDRVGIVGVNSLEWIVAAFATLKCGAILAPMNERFVRDEFRHLVAFSEPAVIVADAPRRKILQEIDGIPPLLALEELACFSTGAPANWSALRPAADTPAMIVFTSGSSGSPKGVMLSHAEQLAKYFEMTLFAPELGPETNSLMPMGIQSAPGTAWGYMFCSVIGGTFHFLRKYSAERTLATLTQERITFFNAVPLIYREMSKLAEFQGADLAALCFARCGGAAVPADTWAAWDAKGVAIRGLYGMTETGGGALIATADEARAKPGSCGRGMVFTQIRIARPDGSECQPNEPGEVFLSAPGIMMGYWRDPDATAQTLTDGWLRTGDIGRLDEEGYFFFVDRARDLVKCGGFNVSPLEVENVIREMPEVDDVSVIAVPDDKYVEVPFACVVARGAVDARQIFEHCKARLANFKLPRYVEFVEGGLPRLVRGKVDKQLLTRTYADAAQRFEKLN